MLGDGPKRLIKIYGGIGAAFFLVTVLVAVTWSPKVNLPARPALTPVPVPTLPGMPSDFPTYLPSDLPTDMPSGFPSIPPLPGSGQ